MKKFIAVVIGTLFVLGFAASAFAIHAEIPSETQAAVSMGMTQVTLGGSVRVRGEVRGNDDNSALTDNQASYDQRTRLSIQATNGPVTGLVMLEAGNGDTADVYTWGTGADGATGGYPYGNAKRGEFQVLESWLLYMGDSFGVKIGHMPLALGNNLFFDHRKYGDDAIVVFTNPSDSLHLAALTAKFDEGLTNKSDDNDAYVGLFAYKGGMFNASGDVTYVNNQAASDEGLHFWNIGLRGDANAGPVVVKADVEVQTGSVESSAGDTDFEGWAALAGLDYAMGDVKLGVEFGYGSGEESKDDIQVFITSLSSGIPYQAFVYGTRATSAAGGTNTGIANTTYLKGTVGAPINDSMSVKGAVIWLQASEDVNGEDEIGVEVDGNFDYKITSNLKYWIEGGYLFTGDFYGSDADDAFALRHGIEFTF